VTRATAYGSPSAGLLARYGRHLLALAAVMPGAENVERYRSSERAHGEAS
jgi:hypothetical protein